MDQGSCTAVAEMGGCVSKLTKDRTDKLERLEENQRDLIVLLKDANYREYEFRRIMRYHACVPPPVPPRRVVRFKTFKPMGTELKGIPEANNVASEKTTVCL